MRNIIKKIKTNIACILTSLLLVVNPIQMPITVQAAEPQFGSSTVTYTVDDYFYVQIPETINVGIQSEIYAYETNIAPENQYMLELKDLMEMGLFSFTTIMIPLKK